KGTRFPRGRRLTGPYTSGACGLFWAVMTAPAASASQGIANAFPPWIRRWAENMGVEKFALLVVFAGLLPIGIDGFTQLFSAVTHYESTNAMRILTGVPGGLVSGLLLGMMVKAIKQFDVEYRVMRARTSLPTPD